MFLNQREMKTNNAVWGLVDEKQINEWKLFLDNGKWRC